VKKRETRVWLSGFLVFFALGAAWALIMPYNSAYDENDHVIRAAGVVRGEIFVKPSYGVDDGGYPSVPESLVPPNVNCQRVSLNVPSGNCLGKPSSNTTLTPEHSRAARYNPIYYAVVGLPLLPFPDMTGVILSRLVNAALCAALLASALVTVWSERRRRLLLLAVLMAVSPMLISLNGLVNPDGIAITAAVLLWVALLRLTALAGLTQDLAEDTDSGSSAEIRRNALRIGVAAATLILARSEGVVIVGVIALLALFAVSDRRAVLRLLKRRDIRLIGLTIAVCVAIAAVWIFASRVASISATPSKDSIPSLSSMLKTDVRGKYDYWIKQTVALFGYGSINMPVWLYMMWSMVLGSLMFGGFAFARRRRVAYTIVAIPLLCFAAGTLAEIYMMHVVGAWMQGRYFLPAWIGAGILAAWALPDSLVSRRVSSRLNNAGVICWIVIQVYCFWSTLNTFRNSNVPTLQPGDPRHWRPEVGLVAPWMVLLVGAVGAALVARAYLRRAEEAPAMVAAPSPAAAVAATASTPAEPSADAGSDPGTDKDEDEPALSSR